MVERWHHGLGAFIGVAFAMAGYSSGDVQLLIIGALMALIGIPLYIFGWIECSQCVKPVPYMAKKCSHCGSNIE